MHLAHLLGSSDLGAGNIYVLPTAIMVLFDLAWQTSVITVLGASRVATTHSSTRHINFISIMDFCFFVVWDQINQWKGWLNYLDLNDGKGPFKCYIMQCSRGGGGGMSAFQEESIMKVWGSMLLAVLQGGGCQIPRKKALRMAPKGTICCI